MPTLLTVSFGSHVRTWVLRWSGGRLWAVLACIGETRGTMSLRGNDAAHASQRLTAQRGAEANPLTFSATLFCLTTPAATLGGGARRRRGPSSKQVIRDCYRQMQYSCVHAPAAAVEFLLPNISPILLPASRFPLHVPLLSPAESHGRCNGRRCHRADQALGSRARCRLEPLIAWAGGRCAKLTSCSRPGSTAGAFWSKAWTEVGMDSAGPVRLQARQPNLHGRCPAGNFVSVQSPASAITRFFKPAPTLSADEQHREQQQQQQQQEEWQEEQQELHHQKQPQPAEMHEQQAEQKPAGPTSLQSEGKTPAQTEQIQQEADVQQGAAAPAGSGSSWSAAEARQHQADAGIPGRGSSARPSNAYNTASGSLEAAVCTAAGQAGPSGSNSRHSRLAEPGEAGQLLAGEVDESVLAELPPELQREIRAQLKTQQMAQRLEKRNGSSGTGSKAAVGGGAGGGPGRPAAAAGGAAVKRSAAPAGVQRIDAFLTQAAKGKKPRK